MKEHDQKRTVFGVLNILKNFFYLFSIYNFGDFFHISGSGSGFFCRSGPGLRKKAIPDPDKRPRIRYTAKQNNRSKHKTRNSGRWRQRCLEENEPDQESAESGPSLRVEKVRVAMVSPESVLKYCRHLTSEEEENIALSIQLLRYGTRKTNIL